VMERGWSIGYNPAAMVWHHRRNSLRGYLRQQRAYGRAEALLERKWPEKYSAAGHFAWAGRLYGAGVARGLGRGARRPRHGTWNSHLFQSLYEPEPWTLAAVPVMPEWQMLVAALGAVGLLGFLWTPLLLALPIALAGFAATLAQAIASAASTARRAGVSARALTTVLHVLQPIARMHGRVEGGLTPWRRRGLRQLVLPRPRTSTSWSERSQRAAARLASVEQRLREQGAPSRRGGEYDRWDIEVRGGVIGAVRLRMAIEEHDGGSQLIRVRSWPRCSFKGVLLILALAALGAAAAAAGAWATGAIFGVLAAIVAGRALADCAAATAGVLDAIEARRAAISVAAAAEVSEA